MSTTTVRPRTAKVVDRLGVLAVVIGMVLGLLPGLGLTTARADDVVVGFDAFEIDGNLLDADDDGDDWSHYPAARNPDDGIGNTDASWFTPSTREGDYPGWTFKSGGNTPKADLIRSYIQTQLAPGDGNAWVALATTRDEDNGNAQVTVEFNQSDLTTYTGAFRTAGDFYIRFNFPGNIGNDPLSPAEAVAAINVRYAVWNGSAFGPELQLDDGTDPAVRAAISSIDPADPDGLTFIELIIDLQSEQLGDLLGDGCTSFGSAGFRTEATGGNQNNDNTTLKDVIQPFPIDLNTCAETSVVKVDAEGNSIAAAEFTIFTDAAGTTPVAAEPGVTFNPCTTGTDGTCSFGLLEPGTYWIDETGVPAGYREDPAFADGPVQFVVENQTPQVLRFTDPRIPYTIDVDPDGANAVGNDHVFVVTLSDDEGPLSGETVDLSWVGVGDGITDIDGTPLDPGVASTTCVTDGSGTCDVTVSSDDPGSGALVASWDTPYQNTVAADGSATTDDGDGTTTPYASISDDATKTWIGYRAEIAAQGLNLVGQPHVFTATVYEVDGTTPDTPASGVDVTFDWAAGTAAGSTLDSLGCRTDLDGTCIVTATDGGTPGTGTISIVNVDGVVGDSEPLSVDFTVGEVSTTKTWREYRVTLDSDSVNPSGEDHTFTATIEYRDDEALDWQSAPDGTTVSLYDWSGDVSVVAADSTCLGAGTTGGTCTFVVTSPAPGSGTLTVYEVEGALLGDAGELDETFAATDDATKTWLDFEVDVLPDGDNLVGEDHVFTIYVEEYDGTDYVPIADGSTVTFSLSDAGASYVSDTCASTTDGACTVTVNSPTTGSVTLTATGITGYGAFDTPADITFDASNDTDGVADEADKTWYDYRAFIAADATNLVGDAHTFTVTAQVDDGTGWGPVADGTVVTVTSSGLAADVDQSDCTNGTSGGTCEVVVDSDDPGTVTITVATVGNESAVDSDVDAVDVSAGDDLEGQQSVSADKTWIAYRAEIEASATNLTGDQHVFTVTAEQDDGTGWAPVPDGTAVDFSTDNDGTVQSDTCTSTTAGTCTITVDSSSVDSVTVTIDAVSAEDVDGDPDATVANGALSPTTGGSLSATKDWIAVVVDAEADETNIIDEGHTFTVDVEVVTPTGTIDAPDGTVVAVSTSGTAGSIVSQTCDAPGTSSGQCTVTVSSSGSGDLTVTVDSVSFTYDSTAFVVDFTDLVSSGEASGQDRTATKTWRDYRVDIEADGFNAVRDPHTFTVTVEQTDVANPTEADWSPVPDGTTATVAITNGPGSITADSCDDGTTDGTCSVTIDSAAAGTTTVTVSEIGVDHPATGLSTTFDVDNDSADKVWVAFRSDIGLDAVNVTGDPHDFTVVTEYTVDGSTWLPVPDGSAVTYTDDEAVGTAATDTCDSTGTAVGDATGECTITVASDTSGTRTVTVTGVSAILTANSITKTFAVTFAADEVGVGTFTAADYSATKTWASYALDLTPDSAVNLLPVDPDHTYTATLTSDDATNAPTGGQTLDITISGEVGTITSVEDGTVATDGLTATCITAADGTCDIVVTSTTPGDAQLDASYDATVGASATITVDAVPSTKTWTTYRVSVTPEQAVNLVGNTHTFTVTVETSSEGDVWTPVADAVPSIEVTGTDLTVDTSDCDDGTAADGTCTVDVTSTTVQAITLTAEYEASIDQSTAAFSDSGDKDWIDYAIDVDPDVDENLVDTDHVFTVTVTTTYPVADGTRTDPVQDAVPTVALADGSVGSITDSTCDEGTDADGQCTVTISSSVPGDAKLVATYIGTAADDAEQRAYSDSGDKLWVDYLLVLSDDAVNAVGDEHTFTATLSIDTGEGFGPAAGETLTFAVSGVGSVTGGDVDGDLVCVTDADGQCDLLINSDEAGATTVDVSYAAVVGATERTDTDDAVKQWVDIELVKTAVVGDGLADGDLQADPAGGDPFLLFSSGDQGPKFAVFEYTITNPSDVTLENVVLVDDRLGTIIDASDGVTLAPGASTTVRSEPEAYTYSDATAALGAPITNIGVVTATGGGEEVTATDTATIGLVAVQSSILIDLVKEVVDGSGDVTVFDGFPTVTWSQDEYEAGVSKQVTYRFTVTNISNATIIDVELLDPMLSDEPLIAVSDGVTLAPDASTVVEVDYVLTVDEAFPGDPTATRIDNVATVSGSNETRDSFSQDVDDASVYVQIVFDELPKTGLDRLGLLPLGVLMIALGCGVLWLNRRRTVVR